MGLIFVLIDGVGLAPESVDNPVPRSCVRLAARFQMPLDDRLHVNTPTVQARPIDANLGVAGRPQSGSGHSAIFGGYNAAAANGRHQPSYPTLAMREHLRQRNMLLLAQQAGASVAWANSYLPGYSAAVEGRRLRHTAGTWSAIHASVPLRDVDHLRAGTAVSWDIIQELARTRPGCEDLPVIKPEVAAARLIALAHRYDLVAFETYLPDLAGHGRIPYTPEMALRLVDALIDTVAEQLAAEDALVVTSDHGNVEDATTRVHTRNPVPLMVWGPVADYYDSVQSIADVMDAVVRSVKT